MRRTPGDRALRFLLRTFCNCVPLDLRYAHAIHVPECPHGCGCGRGCSRRLLEFGCVWINEHLPFVSEMPHGGFKESGYGKDMSVYSLEDYTQIKHVMAKLT